MKKKVLIIDNNPKSALPLREALEHEGYKVLLHSSGEGAIECIRSTRPHVVVLEILLPEVDGLTLLRRLQSSGESRLVDLVIVWSARNLTIDKVDALESGADRYRTKGEPLWLLLSTINTWRCRKKAAKRVKGATTKISGITVDALAKTLNHKNRTCKVESIKVFSLLVTFLGNPDRCYSIDELRQAIWNDRQSAKKGTIHTHISWARGVLKKLKAPFTINLIKNNGYMLVRLGSKKNEGAD